MDRICSSRLTRRDFLGLAALTAGWLATGCRAAPTPLPPETPAPLAECTAEPPLYGPAMAMPGVLGAAYEGGVLRVVSSASPAAVEKALLSALVEEGWLPVERLIPPTDEAPGAFLRFWQGGETACVLAQAKGEGTEVSLAEGCAMLAEAHGEADLESWAPEEQGDWVDWTVGPFALRHPKAWSVAVSPGHA